MKKVFISSIVALGLLTTLGSCVSNQKFDEVAEQNRRLQEQLAKERDENAQLASFRFSLENQFREKSKQYDDCKEDNKESVETMSKKYDQLLTDYKKLEASYKQINVLIDQTKESDARIIADLESKLQVALAAANAKSKRRRKA